MNIEIEKKFGIVNKNNLIDWLDNKAEFLSKKNKKTYCLLINIYLIKEF